jgi:hypothetical protein
VQGGVFGDALDDNRVISQETGPLRQHLSSRYIPEWQSISTKKTGQVTASQRLRVNFPQRHPTPVLQLFGPALLAVVMEEYNIFQIHLIFELFEMGIIVSKGRSLTSNCQNHNRELSLATKHSDGREPLNGRAVRNCRETSVSQVWSWITEF